MPRIPIDFKATFVGLAAVMSLFLVGLFFWVVSLAVSLPDPDEVAAALTDETFDLACEVYDRHGVKIGEIAAERRYYVPLAEIPDHVKNAFVSTEDARFYDHLGVSPVAIVRATIANIRGGRMAQGASTITQQLARTYFLSREKSFARKIKEAMLAVALDQRFSKDKILEIYLNKIFLGNHSYGVEAAARNYFRKHIRDVTVAEAAMLAGLPKAPSRLAPHKNFKAANDRKNYILGLMAENGYLSEGELVNWRGAGIKVYPTREKFLPSYQYATDEVRREINRMFEFQKLPRTGLKVYTTLDAGVQAALGDSVRRGVWAARADLKAPREKKRDLQSAAIALAPRTGDVLGIVGGFRYQESQFNRATRMRRQLGGMFAPFYLARGIELGFTLADRVDAELLAARRGPASRAPTIIDAVRTGHFRDTARVYDAIGHGTTRDLAAKAGFDFRASDHLGLGKGEATPMAVASAFGLFVNKGFRVKPRLIRRVMDDQGTELFSVKEVSAKTAVVDEASAFVMRYALQPSAKAPRDSTSWMLQAPDHFIGHIASTLDRHNSWAAAASERITVVAWLGADRGRVRLGGNEAEASARAGGIVRDALVNLPRGYLAPGPIQYPRDVSFVRPSANAKYSLPFLRGTAPRHSR